VELRKGRVALYVSAYALMLGIAQAQSIQELGFSPLRGSLSSQPQQLTNPRAPITTITAIIEEAGSAAPSLTPRRFGIAAGMGAGSTGFNSLATHRNAADIPPEPVPKQTRWSARHCVARAVSGRMIPSLPLE
jgi:hypothetical protein